MNSSRRTTSNTTCRWSSPAMARLCSKPIRARSSTQRGRRPRRSVTGVPGPRLVAKVPRVGRPSTLSRGAAFPHRRQGRALLAKMRHSLGGRALPTRLHRTLKRHSLGGRAPQTRLHRALKLGGRAPQTRPHRASKRHSLGGRTPRTRAHCALQRHRAHIPPYLPRISTSAVLLLRHLLLLLPHPSLPSLPVVST